MGKVVRFLQHFFSCQCLIISSLQELFLGEQGLQNEQTELGQQAEVWEEVAEEEEEEARVESAQLHQAGLHSTTEELHRSFAAF